MLAADFRRALDLRSTWFAVRVLEPRAAARPRPRRCGPAGRAQGLRARARQGAARAAGERRRLDDRPACARAAGWALHGQGGPEAGHELPPRDAARRRRGSHRQRSLTEPLHGLTRSSRPSGYRRLHATAASSRTDGRGVPRVLCARRGVAVRPLRASGRRVARLRAGEARRADRRARPDRRRPRPLHDQLARGREGARQEDVGERGRGARRLARPGDRTRRDALRQSTLGERWPFPELGADLGLDLRGLRLRGRQAVSLGEAAGSSGTSRTSVAGYARPRRRPM